MELPNNSVYNKWKNICVAGYLQNMHKGMIQTLNSWTQLQDEQLQRIMVVGYLFAKFEMWLQLGKFYFSE